MKRLNETGRTAAGGRRFRKPGPTLRSGATDRQWVAMAVIVPSVLLPFS
jgi:hypothetical protein